MAKSATFFAGALFAGWCSYIFQVRLTEASLAAPAVDPPIGEVPPLLEILLQGTAMPGLPIVDCPNIQDNAEGRRVSLETN